MKNFEKFLRKKYSESTAKRYLRAIQLMIDTIGEEETKTARFRNLTDYIQKLRIKKYSSAFIQTELSAMKAYYAHLVDEGFRTDNPAKNIYLNDQKNRNVQFQDLFSQEELELLLDREERYQILKWRNKLAISFYIYQGLTTGEITNLTVHDLNTEEGTVFIRATSRSNSRLLSLRPKQAIYAERYLTFDREAIMKEETDKLFLGKLGKAETGEGVSYLIECCKMLFSDRNLNPKTIRQSVFVNLFKEGKDIKDVQLFAGHRYPSTTERYKPTDLSELSDAIGRYLDL